MLERYFVRASTIERVRSSWIGEAIEQYVCWLTEQQYSAASVSGRVPVLLHFGEFGRRRGAKTVEELITHVEAFAQYWSKRRKRRVRTESRLQEAAAQVRTLVQQMLRVAAADSLGDDSKRVEEPFGSSAPGFFPYLREERGLRQATIRLYRYNLRKLEAYLRQRQVRRLGGLSPAVLSAYVVEQSGSFSKEALRSHCGVLRVFLRYLHREGIVAQDLSRGVESPLVYRLSSIPRFITWEEVGRMLACVNRHTPVGRRDYAILLLLVTYGLRAHEVAALRLDDIDWRQERLRVLGRKAGHSMAYPLSPRVGEALLQYLKKDRPKTEDRHVFFCVCAPYRPLAEGIERFLAYKRALGRRFDSEERTLRLLDRFLVARRVVCLDEIDSQLVEAFLRSRPRTRPRSYNHLVGVLARLFSWLVVQGDLGYSPVRAPLRPESAARSPFLFSPSQARQLLAHAARLKDGTKAPLRGPIYRTIFALLYGLGLRVGEACRLCCGDVDWGRDLLLIHHTKFAKSRLVPFGPRMAQTLREYQQLREAKYGGAGPQAPLFSFGGERPVHPNKVRENFQSLIPALQLKVPPGVRLPSAHCLRHSFAVSTLLRWYRAGVDPASRLLHLSTFLGHANPSATAVYLTVTAELLQEAGHRYERFAAAAIQEVSP